MILRAQLHLSLRVKDLYKDGNFEPKQHLQKWKTGSESDEEITRSLEVEAQKLLST